MRGLYSKIGVSQKLEHGTNPRGVRNVNGRSAREGARTSIDAREHFYRQDVDVGLGGSGRISVRRRDESAGARCAYSFYIDRQGRGAVEASRLSLKLEHLSS